ncbi:hypothetical protein CPLU01_13070 [Colletotrichum plurivorum]|uniref:Uncharacterized protein n=1 Tax=Colletotrichum plurivorum TaxID=2175906 RepID=A0A8H6JTT9_9PEZI|nr:hypothetical protein CPLU01_13070 [Colletotrichum plurivorum]
MAEGCYQMPTEAVRQGSGEQRAETFLDSRENSGQMGVKISSTNPAYTSTKYKESGATSNGVIVKLVKKM